MRVLRLGNSDDVSPGIPDAERNFNVAAAILAEAAGEPVETIVRPIWPTADLPDLVAGWIEEYRPDFVFLKVTWFWYGYESVPRRVERLLGWAGRPFARAGIAAATNPRFAHRRWFKFGRRMAHRLIGGDTPFDTALIAQSMETVIRRVAAHEEIVLLVKGTGGGRMNEGALEGYHDRFVARREAVEGAIERLCGQLHVAYVGTGPNKSKEDRDIHRGDGVHKGARGSTAAGRQEGVAMAEAWAAVHETRISPLSG
ncbi:MAG: hypothetical protein U0547_14390 [Dehalococcoidia bacterium]